MDTREFKGLELAAKAKIEWRKTYFYVPSQSHKGGYKVDAEANTCTCEDFELRRQPCKHIYAARIVKERNRGKPIPEMPDEELVELPTKRPTYSQDWPAYNAAQTSEKRWFQELLADLCHTIPTGPQHTGRPRIPLCDAVFSAVFKVFSTVSGRRFSCDLAHAKEKGFIDIAPHYNSVFRAFLEDPNTTAILDRLIIQSSIPLRSVESNFAIDSSGFSTSRFLRWFDHKYGVDRKKAEWVKCHIITGVKTNVITAVEINDCGDSPMLKQLFVTTSQNFTIKELSGDKAYSSFANLEFLDDMRAVPYIAYKINSRGDTRPGIWERMFCEFTLNREDFLKHYHQRSNVESTFSMMKAKFGDAIRNKTDIAMKNEVLAKVLCHNLCCLIQEMHELGIDPKLAEPPTPETMDEPTVLKFPGVA